MFSCAGKILVLVLIHLAVHEYFGKIISLKAQVESNNKSQYHISSNTHLAFGKTNPVEEGLVTVYKDTDF